MSKETKYSKLQDPSQGPDDVFYDDSINIQRRESIQSVAEHVLTPLQEAREITKLASGIFISMISWVVIKTTDTALLGHVSTESLSAAAVSDLWMSSTGCFSQGSVLGIFVGQAVGAKNKKLAGVWLQVSVMIISVITLLIMACWFATGPLLKAFHKEELSEIGGYYASVLAACLPARNFMGQLSQFFNAQRIVYPIGISSVFGCIVNLVFGVILVLGIPIPHWSGLGFKACPWVTVGTEWTQLLLFVLVFCYWKQLHKACWHGWDMSEITWDRVKKYLHIYVPSALSMASDFWRMNVIGIFAASLGNLEIAVFNASYRILWMVLTLAGSVASAVGVRLGLTIGSGNIQQARQAIFIGTCMTMGVLLSLSLGVFFCVEYIAKIFSEDEEFAALLFESRLPFCAMLFFMNTSVYLERIPAAMGKTKATFLAGVVGSWGGQVPGAYLCMKFWKNDLHGLYWGSAFGYCLLCLILLVIIISTNWEKVVEDAKHRSEVKREEEETAAAPYGDGDDGEDRPLLA